MKFRSLNRACRLLLLAMVASGALLVAPVIQAQERATTYRPDKVPQAIPGQEALLWFRLAKHSTHRWKIDANIGLGALIGKINLEQTDEKEPLKKPLWPSLQIAPFDVSANEFAGKGESKKAAARAMSKAFYIQPKRFVFEDENYRHYLISIAPGTYVIGGTPSTCFCWGSKRFTVEAGRAYNMGTVYVATENGLSYWPDLARFQTASDLSERGLITDTMKLDYPESNEAPPQAIGEFAFVPARYEDASLFGNHYGRLVNRMIPSDWEPGQPLTLESASHARATNAEPKPTSENPAPSDYAVSGEGHASNDADESRDEPVA